MGIIETISLAARWNWYLLAEYRAAALLYFNIVVLAFLLLSSRVSWLGVGGYLVTAVAVQRRVAAGGQNPHFRSLSGKTAIVTGSNTGIGYFTALRMAEAGCQVVFACRTESKAREAIEQAERALAKRKKPAAPGQLLFLPLDTSSLKSVQSFASQIERMLQEKRLRSLDFLVNNAGAYFPPETPRTAEGFEPHIATNYLGHYLLTDRLLPHIIASKGRVINVASIAHEWVFRLNLSSPTPYADKVKQVHDNLRHKWPEYGLSKACQIAHAKALAKRLSGTGASAVSLHPGGVMTDVFQRTPSLLQLLLRLIQFTNLKTPEEGAQTTLACVFAPEVVNGGYYSDAAYHDDLVKQPFSDADLDAIMAWSAEAVKSSTPS